MESKENIEKQFGRLLAIRYDNEHGGAYAYVQFLAYSRELVEGLKPIRKAERHLEAIEAICWLFNEYLSARFTARQKVIFENKLSELKEIFTEISAILSDLPADRFLQEHAEAA